MELYFPIAEISLNVILVLLLGGVSGVAAGMFGIGGGFILTPLLIFIGVPPAVAVASQANQMVGASLVGTLSHWRRKNVDAKMGCVLLIGALSGSYGGVLLFSHLQNLGQIDLVISLCYIVFLGSIALLMLLESIKSLRGTTPPKPLNASLKYRLHHSWLMRTLPFKMKFPQSKLYISAVLPILIGILVGLLVATMGIGGGFIMIPAMVYILGMPGQMVIGTSLFQIIFTTALTTLLQSIHNQTVDVMLAFLLLIGAVVGVQFGTKWGQKIKPETARLFLAVLALGIALKMATGLLLEPEDPYTLEVIAQ
jgi:hypothetical protein